MGTRNNAGMAYDFSSLSRGRLRTYNLLAEEIERLEVERDGMSELSDDALEMLAAAGQPSDTKNTKNGYDPRIIP